MRKTYKGQTKECKYYKGLKWDKPLTSEMEEFEKETNKKAVFRNKITGQFEYWMYWQKVTYKPIGIKEIKTQSKKSSITIEDLEKEYEKLLQKEKKLSTQKRKVKKITQKDVKRMPLLLTIGDIIRAYKRIYNVKKVYTKSNKFKRFEIYIRDHYTTTDEIRKLASQPSYSVEITNLKYKIENYPVSRK